MSRSRSRPPDQRLALDTQGPAIKKTGDRPTSNAPSLMQSRGPAAMPRGIRAPPVRTPQTADAVARVDVNSGWNWLATNQG